MMKKFFTLLLISFQFLLVQAQNIGIGTTSPNTSAALDISNTAKGLLIPRMTSTGITAIPNPAKGLMVYDSVKNQLMINMGTASIPNWQNIVSSSGWGLTGNAGTANSFIGTTDGSPLVFKVSNIMAGYIDSTAKSATTSFGFKALNSNTTGPLNSAIGYQALTSNTTGAYNAATGYQSLYSNVSGGFNTAIGIVSLHSNISGSDNTAIGEGALYQNNSNQNTAIGSSALSQNTSGAANTATGYVALFDNTTGKQNSAYGNSALYANQTGNYNTATGYSALQFSTTGNNNVAMGVYALNDNTSGSDNTAIGYNAIGLGGTGSLNTATGSSALTHLNTGNFNAGYGASSLYLNNAGDYNAAFGTNSMYDNKTGSYNTAVGSFALYNTISSQFNTVVGYRAGGSYDLGYNNTILGANCDAAFAGAYNDIAIGQAVTCTDNSQARIGNAATGSIGGYANWTNISDGRYKKNLKENVQGLAFIMKLRPVTYNLDITGLSQKLNESRGKTMDPQMRTAIAEKEQVIQTGFVAQEVEQAAAETGYAFSGVDKPKTDAGLYGLRYAEFVVPVVKAMQEQQQMIVDMKKRIDLLEEQNKLLQQLLIKKN